MFRRSLGLCTRIACGLAAAFAAGGAFADTETACDRECLIDAAQHYLEALAARDPASARLAPEIRLVENITSIRPGEGLWASALAAPAGYRIYVPDPDRGTVGIIARIDRAADEGTAPGLLAARLRIEGGKITEAEHLVTDVPDEAGLERLEVPRPGLTAVVPESERAPRAALADIAASYYDALEQSDGTLAPFADDCERQENGVITAGPGLPPASFDAVDSAGRTPPPVARDCAGQLGSRRFAYIDSIDHRRIVAVDPVQGLVMGFSHFRQSMARGPHRLIAADGSEVMWDEQREPYDLPAAHVFKITGGEIHEVEAIGIFVPYGSPTGWE